MPLLTSLKRIWRALPSSNLVGFVAGSQEAFETVANWNS